jgi:hypothetical protein
MKGYIRKISIQYLINEHTTKRDHKKEELLLKRQLTNKYTLKVI